ncbi:MAG: septal ring lytic transglycosylase RlpA family protein [Betaproteobacteria bacterium]|nr:MAG: septal ring lytic transglycosylase RlpA family protein [Betaproteobacteria bacterium]
MRRAPFAARLIPLTALLLVACTSAPKIESPTPAPAVAQPPAASVPPTRPGGYYKDDGPGENPPANLDGLADAIPKLETLNRFANRPYSVFGRDYVPATSLRPYKERGLASWYGRRFHNQKTSTGEPYDMYAMTAAHPTLALPSYARVTNLANGRSVVVRVNDRGPFHPGRIIDLSYAAAHRIGIAQNGSGEVEVESMFPSGAPPTPVHPLPKVAASEPAVASPIPIGQEPGGYVVQLGAFANNVNAQVFVEHLANQITPLGVEANVHEDRGLYRVSVGPYPTRDEARRTADRLRVALGLDSTIKPR